MATDSRRLTVGSLFAGIGGFDLGFERAGFEIKWQVEIDPFCRKVLEKHWPQVRRYGDVRTIDTSTVETVDVVCGGFPCQPHSVAGQRRGSSDDRNLWPEFWRVVRNLEPRFVVVENVPGLLSIEAGQFFGTVLADLAAVGYDTEWACLSASAFGAPHCRDRVWIVAYPPRDRWESWRSGDAAQEPRGRELGRSGISENAMGHFDSERQLQPGRIFGHERRRISDSSWWRTEPNVDRVAYGIPARVDRLRGLGNAIVPQIAQWIAERIKEAEGLNDGE